MARALASFACVAAFTLACNPLESPGVPLDVPDSPGGQDALGEHQASPETDPFAAPDIFVRAGAIEVQSGDTAAFPAPIGGATGSVMEVVIGNAGDGPLTIGRITVEAGGNAFVSFQPPLAAGDFQHVVDANDLSGATAYRFAVKYNPGSQFDDRATRIRIESDDPDEGEFLLIVAPEAKVPRIKVVPDNITFVGATASNPAVQCFEVRNTGTALLLLTDDLTFEQPTSEFLLVPPGDVELEGFQACRKDARIDPDGLDGANPPCKFCVRYMPVDTPDVNYVVIRSDDPIDPTKRVKVEGQTESGDLQVSKADPTCVDFTAQVDGGATCTKVVKLLNNGFGNVTVDRPKLHPATLQAYKVEWYKANAATTTGPCTYLPSPNALIPASQAQVHLAPGDSIDVAVTYVSPGGKGENGTLIIDYLQPAPGSVTVPLCGGAAKCNLELAPPTGIQLVFHGNAPDVKKQTIVLVNQGSGACTVNHVKVPDDPWACDIPGSFAASPPVGATTLPPFGLLPVTVEFRTDLGEDFVISNCQVEVSYVDSYTGMDLFGSVNMTGHRGDFDGVDLPVAIPSAAPPFHPGQPIVLDGSESQGGTWPLYASGYRWFVSAKPVGSLLFLNEPAGGPLVVVTPDAVGHYEFRLVVFSVSDDGTRFYFSDEGVLGIDVVP